MNDHAARPAGPPTPSSPTSSPPTSGRDTRADDPERGDVPGWVLITLMTAGLVIALWAVAGPALANVFETAIARVTGF